jgi:integrase
VSAAAETAWAIGRLDAELDLDAWSAYLTASLAPVGTWRPDEFDPERWLFTGKPDNPMTTSCRCRTLACATVVNSRSFCHRCREALASSGLDEDEFAHTYQPILVVQRLTGEPCVVVRDGVRCERRSISHRSGLCQAHTSRWINSRDRLGVTLEEWCNGVARPLPARPECTVAGCHNDARRSEVVCRGHFLAWQAEQRQGGRVEPAGVWAARQRPLLAAHQFSLADLRPLPRTELLYALQQRDRQGQRLSPQAVRGLVSAWRDLDALVTTPTHELIARIGRSAGYRTYARWVGRILGLKLEAFNGVVHTERDVWDCLALDLEIPRPGVRPNPSVLDFTPITQRWLREAAKAWVATVRPETWHVQRTIQAATLASRALEGRPGGGHDETALRFADLDAIFRSINEAVTGDGRLYDARYRRGLWASFHAVIDLGRATDVLVGLPGVISRHASHSIGHTDPNEDHIGKAVPETVIAQLDAHLDLLGVDGNYGRIWSPADTNALFATAYQVLRDTGRRPGEVVSLRTECLERDGDDWALVYDNHKKRRLRRRLPITSATARIIQAWQVRRGGIDLPQCAEGWLFPAARESAGPGHLTTIRLSQALRAWVDAIPELMSDVPGPDGQPQAFDRLAVYAYAFRHSYAQRHADAGVPVEILKELMDHRTMTVTQGYYTVSLRRKREAIKIMNRYVTDRAGVPAAASGSASSYQLRSVAVPFGNCIEPSNIKAGGKACPIRFQCAGCGFYRPDPSYLPAIEAHINSLRADRETAIAIDADDFVVRNLSDQADAYRQVAATMRDKLAALTDTERSEVEAASATLRKLRAGASIPVAFTKKAAR